MDPVPAQSQNAPEPEGVGATASAGMTRVTFSKGQHTFEFRCEAGFEASLARSVMEMSRAGTTPLEPGDAFSLCRQILSLGSPRGSAGAPGQDVATKPEDGESQSHHRKAA